MARKSRTGTLVVAAPRASTAGRASQYLPLAHDATKDTKAAKDREITRLKRQLNPRLGPAEWRAKADELDTDFAMGGRHDAWSFPARAARIAPKVGRAVSTVRKYLARRARRPQ